MNVFSLVESTFTLAFFGLGGVEILVVGGVALLLFGNRLPGAAKSLGMSLSAFKKGVKEGEDDLEDDSSNSPAVEVKPPAEKVES